MSPSLEQEVQSAAVMQDSAWSALSSVAARWRQPGPGRRLAVNAAANFTSRIVAALLSVAAIPLLLRLLGADALGLVTLMTTWQAVFAVLDLGLTGAVTRATASASAQDPAFRHWLRVTETYYFLAAAGIGVLLLASCHWIATSWLHAEALSAAKVIQALTIMSISFALQWPTSVYQGMLRGLERQVTQNGLTVTFAALRTLGGLAVVAFWRRDLTLFLLWQMVFYALEMVVTRIYAFRSLGRTTGLNSVPFDKKDAWKFALSFNVVVIIAMMGGQADRLVLSRFVSLSMLGFYAAAATAAGALMVIGNALSIAAFPQFAASAASGDHSAARAAYIRAQRIVYSVAPPILAVLALNARNLLLLWTRNGKLADAAWPTLIMLSTGYCIWTLTNAAFNYLNAAGHMRITIRASSITAVASLLLLIVVVPRWGLSGAAAVCILQMMVPGAIYVVTTRRLLSIEHRRIAGIIKVCAPFAAAAAVVLLLHGRWPVISLFASAAAAGAAAALALAAEQLAARPARNQAMT